MGSGAHCPVMVEEVLGGLNICSGGHYLDCTFGRGGHSAAILESLGPDGRVLALDKDSEAVNSEMAQRLKCFPGFEIQQSNFACMQDVVEESGLHGKLTGVLMDLGVSSPQIDNADRGFSFFKDGPLDMRMDRQSGQNAAEWLNVVSEAEMANVFRRYGEERFSRRIAHAIAQYRIDKPITRTLKLATIIAQAVPFREPGKHPATRTFQAIRIFINNELEELKAGLRQAFNVLIPGGRLVVIAFHSLEDRIVKRYIRDESRGDNLPADLPVLASTLQPRLEKIGKAQKPSHEEVAKNPRSRSAVLRVAKKLA